MTVKAMAALGMLPLAPPVLVEAGTAPVWLRPTAVGGAPASRHVAGTTVASGMEPVESQGKQEGNKPSVLISGFTESVTRVKKPE